MPTPDLSAEDRRLIDSLLGAWEEAAARGKTPRPEAICPDRPDLWEPLVARAAQLEAMAFLDGEPQAAVSPGQRLNGRFRLIELLAAGGHAEVWRAADESLPQDVAVKLIPIGPLADPNRLIEEGKMLVSLKHKHIVRVLDAGIEDGIAFLVQDLVTGETLAERITSGPLPEERILTWISDVAEALQAAHVLPAGIIHRDVKPANILIDGHGDALLADFGIALPIGEAASGTSAGTLPYKSPEQLDGRQLDRRSDVFSLALVLFEALTGTLPYSAHDADTIRREMREPLTSRIARLPAPRPLPARFLPLLERALAVHPDARPRDAFDFREELIRAAASGQSSGRPSGRGRQLAIAATLVAIAATLAAMAVEAINAERTRRRELEQQTLEEEQRKQAEQAREREQRDFEAQNRRVMQDVQQDVNRAMGLFKEVQGKISGARQLERDVIEQTRERDPFRRDRPRQAAPITQPPPRPDDGSSSERP